MRHLLGDLAVYVIAAMIVGGAAFFAWVRSSQVVLSDERTVIARYQPASRDEFAWETLGRESYQRNCANCHGQDGAGWDQYPALSNAGDAVRRESGRAAFIDLHLRGLDTPQWRVPMPPMGHLPDAELAALLNHVVTAFGGVALGRDGRAQPFDPSEIASRRTASARP